MPALLARKQTRARGFGFAPDPAEHVDLPRDGQFGIEHIVGGADASG